jgi:ATP adenylyltransferase
MNYVGGKDKPADGTCVFCNIQAEDDDDRERLVLRRTRHTFVAMNRYPYSNGHLLVLPRQHQADLSELDEDTFVEIHQELRHSVQVLRDILQAQGANVGLNLGAAAGAGIPGHMHYHIVPRWAGDTNFMPVVGETKVISQHILQTYDLLLPSFA